MYTYTIGPLSYTTVIISLSTVITALSGIFYGQTLTVTQIIGVLFMIACFILSPEKQKGESKASAKWLIVCIIATMLTGALGLIQTFHQKSDFRTEMPCMLITCFVVCVIVSFMFFLFTKSTLPESAVNVVKRRNRRLIIILSVLSGLTYSVCHVFNLYLAGALPTVIMFPVVNLVPMILTVIIGKIMFKEKLSFKRWTGIVIGILSTVLLSGFIDSLIK
ncbi:MAG: EamA family transporter [Oscillospiraceae bacterium]|nr:EamA family transporter [Candidatus Equicaccousia limihippi]